MVVQRAGLGAQQGTHRAGHSVLPGVRVLHA